MDDVLNDNDVTKISVPNNLYTKYIKRLLDIVLSFSGLLLLFPLFLIVALLELVFHGQPILYKTRRPGKNAEIFTLYKFRSMTNEKKDGRLLSSEMRITKFGKFLRKTSIDELPELFNVLKGDMSIIGPRPLLIEYLPLYNARHSQRHLVRPGLGCFKLIQSRKGVWTWGDQFENDIYYIEHLSFLTDLKMLLAIVREVLSSADYRASATRVPFSGDDSLYETRSRTELKIESHFTSIGT